jgi:hypothetical protein
MNAALPPESCEDWAKVLRRLATAILGALGFNGLLTQVLDGQRNPGLGPGGAARL